MDKLLQRYCQGLQALTALCLAIMVVLVLGNVVLRYIFNSGIAVSEEVSRWLFVWVTFLGAIFALREHGHLGTEMLVGRLGTTGKKICLVIGYALMLMVCWMLFSGALQQTRLNWDVSAPSSGASLAWFYSVGIVFSISAAAILLNDAFKLVTGRVADADLIIVKESEEQREAAMTIIVFVASLLGAMALGIPISFALLVCGAALMWHLGTFDAQILAENVIHGADSYPLLAIPFFLLAGEIMNAGGLSRRIVNLAMVMVGHIRGGLGYVTIISACLLAALSGSAVADAAALSTLLLPMMVAAGHDKARSAGLIASAGVIAPVVPPSIGYVVFGVAANVSISRLFFAGIFPGLMLALSLWFTWWWLARRENVEPPARKSLRDLAVALKQAALALGLPFIIIVGLKMGVFTPTEAGVVAAAYALVISTLVYRELSLPQLYHVFVGAVRTTSVVMLLVAAAAVSAWLITVAEIPGQVVALLEPLLGSPTLLMVAIMVLVMVVGTALDLTPTILIMTPVLMPLVKAAGIDPVYFGVLFMMNNAIGLITPPVGVVLNTVAGVGKVSMDAVTKGVLPFMLAEFIVMFLMVLFPKLVTVPAHWFY